MMLCVPNYIMVQETGKKISKLAVDLVKQHCLSHKLKIPDAQIAATAILHNTELLTLNKKDFMYIPNLKLFEIK